MDLRVKTGAEAIRALSTQ
ncbi:TPA: hypothetical protein ACHKV6_005221, partial [Escherichia coli]|nr:hypothetical protein [Escherichia coli]MCN5134466.1 hypothetical protein [Escherichia coli]